MTLELSIPKLKQHWQIRIGQYEQMMSKYANTLGKVNLENKCITHREVHPNKRFFKYYEK